MELNHIRYQDAATRCYLGSPSILRLPSGDLLATHDYFGPGSPHNHNGRESLTSVYRSTDNGAEWTEVNHIANAFWSGLFAHAGAVYLLGVSQHWGDIVIRRSDDGGLTWTHPADERSGLLFRKGPGDAPSNYHCAPVPVLHHNGRLYRAFEDCTSRWGEGFAACVISAPADADLLDAASWTMSNKLHLDRAWLSEGWGALQNWGWLEGNIVADPESGLWDLLRVSTQPPVWDRACLVRVSEDGLALSFDPANGLITLPGGHTKFTIRRDPITGLYFTLSNGSLDPAWPAVRTVLALYASRDLRDWQRLAVLLQDDTGLPYEASIQAIGFQYADWQFDGEDIIAAVRTAYDGAHNYHDANRITFHVIRDFRKLALPIWR